jgi:hypothetical protein
MQGHPTLLCDQEFLACSENPYTTPTNLQIRYLFFTDSEIIIGNRIQVYKPQEVYFARKQLKRYTNAVATRFTGGQEILNEDKRYARSAAGKRPDRSGEQPAFQEKP